MIHSNPRARIVPILLLIAMTVTLTALAARKSGAASIVLETDQATVVEGGLIEIRIFGSGFPDGTDGGDFALRWSSNLSFVGLTIADPPWDLSAYDESGAGAGAIGFVDVFSFIDTPGANGGRFEIATLTLLGSVSGPAEVDVAIAQVGWGLAGLLIDGVDYADPISISVTPIPEPGTAGLLGLGLALFAVRGRPQRR